MKLFRKNLKAVRTAAQKGFTLIELAIVGLFLGLLAVFAISQFSGSATDSTRASGLVEASQKVADNWSLVAQTCGADSNITTLNLATNAATTPAANAAGNLSMLLGNTAAHDSFKSCFNQSGVRPLTNLAVGAAGAESVYGYVMTVSNVLVNSRNALAVSYAGVPDSVTLALYNKMSSVANASTATAVPATADTTDAAIRFSTATGGKRTVTLVRVL